MSHTELEEQRLAFVGKRDGFGEALDFAFKTYKIYRACLLLKRSVLDRKGMQDKKPHHATFPQYRRGFIESCCVFRKFIYRKWQIEPQLNNGRHLE